MNGTILAVAGSLASSGLLLDFAVKGTALLVLAAVVAALLRRDSAATRHLVWLLAIVAMLALPLLSAALPEWRVLPQWAGVAPELAVAEMSPRSVDPVSPAGPLPQTADYVRPEPPRAAQQQPVAEMPDARPAPVMPEAVSETPARNWTWIGVLPFVWTIGSLLLILRLIAARWLLRTAQRRATVIGSSVGLIGATDDLLLAALKTTSTQLRLHRPVTLLVHPRKTIPVVWGVLRSYLMLPAAARQWGSEQLRSVLLHELAHVQRRDTAAQLLSQVACALHWFNPLVWFAAWRLGVEGERACDDLVLASGVRPSAYAGHLLEIVADFSPARWMQSCGLAMARKSSLEGRLLAVISGNLNRRAVPLALAAIALALTVGIAVPIAMLRAADKEWNPPQAAHVGSDDVSTYCVHDGKDSAFVILYRGGFNSATSSSHNEKARTWQDSGTLTLKTNAGKKEIAFQRDHTAPQKLKLAGKDYDLTQGRVFLVSDDGGAIRQLDISPPAITTPEARGDLAKQIAALPPQTREKASVAKKEAGEKLDAAMEQRLKWGEPVKGLRAAIVIRHAPGQRKPGDFPDLHLAVQNASNMPIRLCDTTAAPDLRTMYLKDDGRILSAFVSATPTGVDVTLQPREVVMLLTFPHDAKDANRRTTGSIVAEELLGDAHLSMAGKIQIQRAPAGAWTGELTTGDVSGEVAANKPLPRSKEGLALYRQWQTSARIDRSIPGALVGRLAAKVRYFISLNRKDSENGRKLSERFEKLLPRFDATRDWSEADAVALLDDVAAIHRIPLNTALEIAEANAIHGGEPLPADLENAPWGQPSPDGLRVAYLVEPRAKQYPLGTPLGARILVYNAGKKPVVFTMPSWQQAANHAAHDAKGAAIAVSSTHWLTQGQKRIYRLWPGMYCECLTPGIGIGAETTGDNWANVSVGSHIDAKPGDDVRFTPGRVQVNCSPSMIGTTTEDGRPTNVDPKNAADLWETIVTERVGRELPLPAAAAERDQIIRRVMVDLTGNLPTQEEIAAFVNDRTPDAYASLIRRLVKKPGIVPFTGKLQPGDIQFHVLPADANAAKKPRIVTGPGYYNLGDHERLSVERAPYGQRRTNKATIQFSSADPKAAPPGKPYEILLPDGVGTYCITWVRGITALWVIQKGMVRAFDFTNPAQVIETTFKEPAGIEKLPKPIADALPPLGDTPSAPPASVKP